MKNRITSAKINQNKTSKTRFLSLAIVLTVFTTAEAQQKKPPSEVIKQSVSERTDSQNTDKKNATKTISTAAPNIREDLLEKNILIEKKSVEDQSASYDREDYLQIPSNLKPRKTPK